MLNFNNFGGEIIMKKEQTRSESINIRTTKDEYEIIKGKAKEAKMPLSSFVRKCSLNSNIQPVINGKEIATGIGLLHDKMQIYRHDIISDIEKIKESVNILQEQSKICNYQTYDILKLECRAINATLAAILNKYENQETQVEKAALALTSPIKEWEV